MFSLLPVGRSAPGSCYRQRVFERPGAPTSLKPESAEKGLLDDPAESFGVFDDEDPSMGLYGIVQWAQPDCISFSLMSREDSPH
jgi:hypothetical protein